MSRVVFTWELGGGLGHLVRYRALIGLLCQAGHEVSFLARDVARARRVFDGQPVELVEAPAGFTPPAQRISPPNSFAEVLLNSGFADAAEVCARLRRWLDLLAPRTADVVIADYSPTAVLAGRVLGLRTIASGNGFYLPPALTPLPPFRYWEPSDRGQLARHEQRLLGIVNAALATCGAPPAASVAEALVTPTTFVHSFAEFDHCYERPHASYLGAYPSAEFGAAPAWPAGPGPRVFAYLDPEVLFPALLSAVRDVGARLCVYAPGVDAATVAAAPDVVWMHEPVDLKQAAQEADAYLSNANINSMMVFLLAGKPQLVVPYTLEKYLVGRRLEMLGAGLSAPRRGPGDIGAKLRAVLTQRSYRRAAEQFAGRYAHGSEATLAAEMLHRLALPDARKIN